MRCSILHSILRRADSVSWLRCLSPEEDEDRVGGAGRPHVDLGARGRLAADPLRKLGGPLLARGPNQEVLPVTADVEPLVDKPRAEGTRVANGRQVDSDLPLVRPARPLLALR